jgi:membrane peptidoglycan carboxypeptidase
MLWQATVASLNVTFFGLTERLGAANVIDMAIKAGVDSMWANEKGRQAPLRIDLRGKSGRDVVQHFSTEVGIGQYGITVMDHANGMATFAAAGKRAQAHFVRSVTKNGKDVYAEHLTQTDVGLDQDQVDELNWTLSQVEAAKLANGWDSAGKTGTWQFGKSTTQNAHTWMVGYTKSLAAAVWLGTTDGKVLTTKTGAHNVFGANYPGPIWRQFMVEATAAMKLDKSKSDFSTPKFLRQTAPPPTPPPPAPQPTQPTPKPSCEPQTCPSTKPTHKPSPTPSPARTSRPPRPSPTLPAQSP